jgi:hypothetical protein
MFKATLDGNGLVIYSDQPGGELLSAMPLHEGTSINANDLLPLEPSIVLKGAFAMKNSWSAMASSDRPNQMSDFAPFDMIRFGLHGSLVYEYLLSRHPALMLISVEVEYKELPGTSLPVGLTANVWPYGGETPSSIVPFFFREATGNTKWQTALLDLNSGELDPNGGSCPFRNISGAPTVGGGIIFTEPRHLLYPCFKHVKLWTQSEPYHIMQPPVFAISGGVGAVRRISFNFASSQFWTGFTNSAELVQLYERPAPPEPVDPDEPPSDEPELVVTFEGFSQRWFNPEYEGGSYRGYRTAGPGEEGCLNVFSGDAPWSTPYSVVKVGGGVGGVAVPGDGYNENCHLGTNGGSFRFYANGDWQFDGLGMFWDLEAGETRTTSCNFIVQDEFGEHLCRVDAIITGEAEWPTPDQYTLRYFYLGLKSTDFKEDWSANLTGNVFDNAEDPDGWTVTAVRGSSGNVGNYVDTVNADFTASYKINANGDYEIRVGPNFLENANPPAYEYGHVFICQGSYTALKGATTKGCGFELYVTLAPKPGFADASDASVIVKVAKNGQTSGQIDFSNLLGVEEVTVLGTYYWISESDTSTDYSIFVGETGHPIYYYENVEPYAELVGGLLQIGHDGSWSFDTNGDFDYLGSTEIICMAMPVELENEDGVKFEFVIKLQIGDTTQDCNWEEGP